MGEHQESMDKREQFGSSKSSRALMPLGNAGIQWWKCFPFLIATNRVKLGPQFQNELMRVEQSFVPYNMPSQKL